MAKPHAAPTGRWQRRKEARPGEIIAAALAAFAERGFAATRLEDVAERAGVTKGTLYLYFSNKEELFKAVVRQAIVSHIARNESLAAASGESARVAITRIIGEWSGMARTPASAIPKIIIAEAGNFPDIARFYLEEVIHRGLGLFQRLLRLGIERGEFRPVDVAPTASCIVAPLLIAMLWRHCFERHEGQPLDVTALCQAHLQILFSGLAPTLDTSVPASLASDATSSPGARRKRKAAAP